MLLVLPKIARIPRLQVRCVLLQVVSVVWQWVRPWLKLKTGEVSALVIHEKGEWKNLSKVLPLRLFARPNARCGNWLVQVTFVVVTVVWSCRLEDWMLGWCRNSLEGSLMGRSLVNLVLAPTPLCIICWLGPLFTSSRTLPLTTPTPCLRLGTSVVAEVHLIPVRRQITLEARLFLNCSRIRQSFLSCATSACCMTDSLPLSVTRPKQVVVMDVISATCTVCWLLIEVRHLVFFPCPV